MTNQSVDDIVAPDQYDRYAFLRQCDEIIRLCQLTQEMGDEELETIAALAEARYMNDQEELAKDQEQLLEQQEAEQWDQGASRVLRFVMRRGRGKGGDKLRSSILQFSRRERMSCLGWHRTQLLL